MGSVERTTMSGMQSADSNSLNAKKKAHIERALTMAHSDLQRAAELLQISPPRLRYWIRKLQIDICIQSPDSGRPGHRTPSEKG